MYPVKSKTLATLTAVLAAVALSGPAYAGEQSEAQSMEKPAFEELDANIDGVITEQEAQETWLAAVFDKVDQDQNGLVNRSEYEKAVS